MPGTFGNGCRHPTAIEIVIFNLRQVMPHRWSHCQTNGGQQRIPPRSWAYFGVRFPLFNVLNHPIGHQIPHRLPTRDALTTVRRGDRHGGHLHQTHSPTRQVLATEVESRGSPRPGAPGQIAHQSTSRTGFARERWRRDKRDLIVGELGTQVSKGVDSDGRNLAFNIYPAGRKAWSTRSR